jgi:pimeloyl-ACP methyl ester carboxylesterase
VLALAQACAAQGGCVIAPDTPGNGASDAMPAGADIAAFARRSIALCAAIGVARAAFYGFHTGAAIAAAVAAQAPNLVSGLVLDGLPIWSAQERSDLLAQYLAPFAPTWDGGHLAWLWARMEEQQIFYPWHRWESDARLAPYGVSPAAHLDANARDLLKAGDHYRIAYAAAFRFVAQETLARVTAPCWITAAPNDPLAAQRARLDPKPHFDLSLAPDDRAARIEALAARLLAFADAPAPDEAPSGMDAAGQTRGYWRHHTGEIGYIGPHDPRLIWLHDAGAAASLHADQDALRCDLPGHGEAGWTWPSTPATLADVAALMHEALAAGLGKRAPLPVTGAGLGARIAQRLSGADSAPLDEPPPPDLSARWDGAHLISAWRYLRRRAIFTHWDRPDSAHYRTPMGALDAAALQAHLIALLSARAALPNAWAARSR